MSEPRDRAFEHQLAESEKAEQRDGEWVQCPHCDATGKQEGPGGLEECCHCRGRGERWFEDKDDTDTDQS